MDLPEFQSRVKKIEQVLENLHSIESRWIEPQWFSVEPINEGYFSISIRYEFDEVRVGIEHVKEYYSDSYGNGRSYDDGINRFVEILHSRIKKRIKYKGSFHFKSEYFIEIDGKFEIFATFISWIFPFWQKTKITELMQNPILID